MRPVKVWDVPTRAFHWALVVIFATAFVTGEDKGGIYVIHTYAGYLVILLLVYRIIWGVAGNEHARFKNFVRPWPEVRVYAGKLLKFAPPNSIGHNPLGGWMVVAMILVLWAVVMTGLVAAGKEEGAFLYFLVPKFVGEIFGELHEGIANFMLLLILLHVFGVVMDWLLTGDNLIAAMVTGVKKIEDDVPAADARGGSPTLAILIAIACVVLGILMVRLTSFSAPV